MGIGNIANTGMQAAMSDMEIISNNIANANTIGYKRSFGTFGDLYPYGSGGSTLQAGLGVALSSIQQDFTRGGAQYTNSQLDLMIDNQGFFAMKDPNSGVLSYTRAGRFVKDSQGYITNGSQRLQGFPAKNGVVSSGGALTDLQISNTPLSATPSANVTQVVNLNSGSSVITGTFNQNDPTTYNYMSNATVYDSLGNSHSVSMYYIKTASNTWTANAVIDGTLAATGAMSFNTNGTVSSVTGLSAVSFAPGTGATSPQVININLSGATQNSGDSSQTSPVVDGYPVGTYSGFQVDNSGNVIAMYSNQQSKILGKIAIAQFSSPNNLADIGNMSWVATTESGNAILNPDYSNNNINAGVVETSNVDLTQEMISLINAQHDFQANAQVEQAYNETIQTVIKL